MSAGDFVQLLTGAAVIAAVVGGIFRVHASRRTQARSEARKAIDDIREMLDQVQDLARSYYMCAGHDANCPALSLQIRGALQKLGTRVTVLNLQFKPGNTALLSYAFRFKQAVSLDLDSRLRPACGIEDERFATIQAQADRLLLELERLFALKHD